MSKQNSKKSSLIAIVVLLVLVLVVGLILAFTSLGEDVGYLLDTRFYVEYNGVKYTGKDNKILLSANEQPNFKVYTLNSYKVSVSPNVTSLNDFVYTVDDVRYRFSETNLTSVFVSEINLKVGRFTLNAIDDYSIKNVLSKVYAEKTVVVEDDLAFPYLLTITSGDSKVQFLVGVVKGVELDKPDIVV